jgi:hypothetical protein
MEAEEELYKRFEDYKTKFNINDTKWKKI